MVPHRDREALVFYQAKNIIISQSEKVPLQVLFTLPSTKYRKLIYGHIIIDKMVFVDKPQQFLELCPYYGIKVGQI